MCFSIRASQRSGADPCDVEAMLHPVSLPRPEAVVVGSEFRSSSHVDRASLAPYEGRWGPVYGEVSGPPLVFCQWSGLVPRPRPQSVLLQRRGGTEQDQEPSPGPEDEQPLGLHSPPALLMRVWSNSSSPSPHSKTTVLLHLNQRALVVEQSHFF